MFRTRVLHLMETEPQATWEKFQNNRVKLYEEASQRVDAALQYKEKLQDRDLPPGGLEELVNNFLAPLDVPIAENQLSDEQQAQIWEWANDPPESKDKTT